MNRRDFLSICGLTVGSCIIPVRLARVIRDTCVLGGQPYLIDAPVSGSILYAEKSSYGQFTFRLGEEVGPPTWREYFEDSEGIDPDDLEAVNAWQREYYGIEPGDENNVNLEEKIDGGILDNWYEWDYSLRCGPEAKAYHFLDNLPLEDGRKTGGRPIGELQFVQGDHPGSNYTCVEAADLATLACLQHRLNKLDTDIRIEIRQ